MEEQKIIIDKSDSIVGLTMVTVTQISVNIGSTWAGTAIMATKRPLAMVVVSSQAKRAFRITGEGVLLEELIQEYPGLKDYL